MKKIITIITTLYLIILPVSCSRNTQDYTNNNTAISSINISTPSASLEQKENGNISITKDNTPSGNNPQSVSVDKIFNILSTKNNDVIESLHLLDSDNVKSLNDSRFYVPVFDCKELGILIGFNGTQFDTIDKVKNKSEPPIFIMPTSGTIISFDRNINFRIGDDIKHFKDKFGEGIFSREWNLKGDKQNCFLTYEISNLKVKFMSLNGDDFKEYTTEITRLQ